MIKTKYWLSILAVSVVLLTGSLAISPIAIADDDDDDDDDDRDDDDEIVITGTTGREVIFVLESTNPINPANSGSIVCRPIGSCTVTGPVTGPTTQFILERWTINPGVGDGVDTKYKINGNGGNDFVSFADGTSTDDDEVEFKNTATVRIFDDAGDDEYVVKGSSGDRVEYDDGPGDDELEFEG